MNQGGKKTMKKIFYKIFIFFIISLLIMPISVAQMQIINIKCNETNESSLGNSICDLLIITPSYFEKALQPLKEHKNKFGVRTDIVTLDYIYKKIWYGRDNPEKIKYFIFNAYKDAGIKYVLLVGNFRKMPIRYVHNEEPGYPELYFISELYYADIIDKNGSFSSWDSNNNGVFGEWNGSEAQDKDIDLYPDVYVGRLACRNNLEVKIMVRKIINYESKTYGSQWFNRIVAVAGDTYPPGSYPFPTDGYEGEENTLAAIDFMIGFKNTTLFTSDKTLTGPNDIIREVDKGCGFLYFEGHGNPGEWTTHPVPFTNESKWIKDFTVLSMIRLTNGYKLPICVVGGCHNSEFDVNIFNIFEKKAKYLTWIPECWSWKLTRKIGGGSIATIGNTGLGMSKEDKDSMQGAGDYIENRFFYEIGINGTGTLGDAWGKAISDYLDKYPINWNTPAAWDYSIDAKTVQQWVLLGDPSLKIGGYPVI